MNIFPLRINLTAMKFLLFSDVHCNTEKCRNIIEKSKQADLVIGAGDFATARRGLSKTIDLLSKIDKPTVVVPGNSESFEELKDACRVWPQAHVLHGSQTHISGFDFFGIGGGIPVTPFGDWSYDFTERQAAELLKDCPGNVILITHSPPKGAVDISSSGKSLGSTTIRDTILTKKPVLCVCGHIHESCGKQTKLNETVVINAGPNGLIWETAKL